jgi:hypothetical protein
MTDDNLLPFCFPAVRRKKITAAFDGGRISSDGGVMLARSGRMVRRVRQASTVRCSWSRLRDYRSERRSSGVRPAWRRIARRVPRLRSRVWTGTVIKRPGRSECRR